MAGRIAAVATQRPPKAETSSPPRRSARAKLLVRAEDRGFEPRRALPPNRISSAFPLVPGRSGNDRDRTGWQVSRAGNAGIVPGPAADARRVRTRNGHTHRCAGPVPWPGGRRRCGRSRPGRPGRGSYRPRHARRPRRSASAWPYGQSALSRFACYTFAVPDHRAACCPGLRPRQPGRHWAQRRAGGRPRYLAKAATARSAQTIAVWTAAWAARHSTGMPATELSTPTAGLAKPNGPPGALRCRLARWPGGSQRRSAMSRLSAVCPGLRRR